MHSAMKKTLKNLIVSRINEWTEPDIYALSLFVYDENDNPCKPTVTLGYNTERQYRESLPHAYDEAEARWNYAFWLQNDFLCFGTGETAASVREWLVKKKLPFYEDDDPAWDDDLTYTRTAYITGEFVRELVSMVKQIHKEKVLTEKFGKELPIIIHELEYYPEIAQQNVKANGDLIDGSFLAFCGMK